MENVRFIGTFYLFASCFSSSHRCGLYGLQLRAEQPAYGGSTARGRVTKKSMRQTDILHVSFGSFQRLSLEIKY